MIIQQQLSLLRITRISWKTDLFLVLTCIATFYIHEFLVPEAINIPPMLATLLGTALAFFVGFNNNQAYSRWWEARIIWGALVNDSRSWARALMNYTKETSDTKDALTEIRKKMILQQIAFIYALKENLRRKADGYFERYLNEDDMKLVRQQKNIPNAILSLNATDLQKLSELGAIDPFRFVELNEQIRACTDHMGKSERIRNTVFPTSYLYFTRLFIWVLVIFVTLTLADDIGYWSILFGWVIGFVFHVTHINGMGLVDPFDEIPTGIPLNQISRTIEINLLQMLGSNNLPDPEPVINNEYVL